MMPRNKDLTVFRLPKKKSSFWEKEALLTKIGLFLKCAKEVTAYKDFLKRNNFDTDELRKTQDFKKIPVINKENYLRFYRWEDLFYPESLTKKAIVLTSTSGSTGKPFYFPRERSLDIQSSIYHQMFLYNAQIEKKRSTLVLVCFGMGVWIGGILTYQAFKLIAERGYAMTILTPGVNKKEIFEALVTLANKYDQVILCGYPPFIKDVVDEGEQKGIVWQNFNLKIIFAAESFSEKFRDYILEKTGIKGVYRNTANIYGSADLGTMAIETPISILIRRLCTKNKKLYERIFHDTRRLPSFLQYVPSFINFEEAEGKICCTGDNILPLIRYEIGDTGGVFSFEQLKKIFEQNGMDLYKEAKLAGIEETVTQLPFVYVYERSDFSTKLYGAIIYPEYIKLGLQDKKLEKYVTGKFTFSTEYNRKQNEYLSINIELKPQVKKTTFLKEKVTKSIVNSLIEKSAEYKNNMSMMPNRVCPRITFWEYNHPLLFPLGVKQKWLKK